MTDFKLAISKAAKVVNAPSELEPKAIPGLLGHPQTVGEAFAALSQSRSVTDAMSALGPSQTVAEAMAALSQSQTVSEAMAALSQSRSVTDAMSALGPSQTVSEAMAALSQSRSVADAMSALGPSQTVAEAMAALSQSRSVTDAMSALGPSQTVAEAMAALSQSQTVSEAMAALSQSRSVTDAMSALSQSRSVTDAMSALSQSRSVTDAMSALSQSRSVADAMSALGPSQTVSEAMAALSQSRSVTDAMSALGPSQTMAEAMAHQLYGVAMDAAYLASIGLNVPALIAHASAAESANATPWEVVDVYRHMHQAEFDQARLNMADLPSRLFIPGQQAQAIEWAEVRHKKHRKNSKQSQKLKAEKQRAEKAEKMVERLGGLLAAAIEALNTAPRAAAPSAPVLVLTKPVAKAPAMPTTWAELLNWPGRKEPGFVWTDNLRQIVATEKSRRSALAHTGIAAAMGAELGCSARHINDLIDGIGKSGSRKQVLDNAMARMGNGTSGKSSR